MDNQHTAATTAASNNKRQAGHPNTVSIRMYCIGTGDCFILNFFDENGDPFTMMIDCGCCVGDQDWYEPYVKDLKKYVNNTVDLLVVTHEHQDHVNGFDKWSEIFQELKIKEAWFAWTEEPGDPHGEAAELLMKKEKMKKALGNAIAAIKKRGEALNGSLEDNFFKDELIAEQKAFVNGLDSLAEVNLADATPAGVANAGKDLPGMRKIKEILKKHKVNTRYLGPGETVTIKALKNIQFHVLGPPRSREAIFKDGKEGRDVFKKNMALNNSSLAANAFSTLGSDVVNQEDYPFTGDYLVSASPDEVEKELMDRYNSPEETWRTIEDEWLLSAGSLAIRLNSHINNTSLALAIESINSGKVLLMPGDAEYGSWESWHLIKKWNEKGRNGKHLVEDLLNRTVFYKVGHHLSYNGTALDKGVNMMTSSDLVAMATLDRKRISEKWKSTMPNTLLLKELTRKTGGRFFIMNETDFKDKPSLTLDPASLGENIYREERREDDEAALYKQYTLEF